MDIITQYYRLGPGNYAKLSRRTGLTRSHVGRALQGQAGLSLKSAAKIAAAAGVTLDDLWEFIQSYRRNDFVDFDEYLALVDEQDWERVLYDGVDWCDPWILANLLADEAADAAYTKALLEFENKTEDDLIAAEAADYRRGYRPEPVECLATLRYLRRAAAGPLPYEEAA